MAPDKDAIFQLYGMLRLNACGDCIVVPTFRKWPGNHLFVINSDVSMGICDFTELTSFDEFHHSLNVEEFEKTQYCAGDIAPVLICAAGTVSLFSGATLEDVADKLRGCDVQAQVIEDALDIIQAVIDRSAKGSPGEMASWPDSTQVPVEPGHGRLWLDNALAPIDPRVLRAGGKSVAHHNVRLTLLSWALGVAQFATSPIFEYYLQALAKAEREGVHVEDLMATAILRRALENIPRERRVSDLIRSFRLKYGRGPLASARQLADNSQGTFSDRAQSVLRDYYEFVRGELETGSPIKILSATFAGDSFEDWPDDLRKSFGLRADSVRANLEGLVAERNRALALYDKLLRDRAAAIKNSIITSSSYGSEVSIDVVKRSYKHLRDLADDIEGCVSVLDAIDNVITGRGGRKSFIPTMGEIDFESIGINKEFIVSMMDAAPNVFDVDERRSDGLQLSSYRI